jgi:hypothetical protein
MFREFTFNGFQLEEAQSCQRELDAATLAIVENLTLRVKFPPRTDDDEELFRQLDMGAMRAFSSLLLAFSNVKKLTLLIDLSSFKRRSPLVDRVLQSERWATVGLLLCRAFNQRKFLTERHVSLLSEKRNIAVSVPTLCVLGKHLAPIGPLILTVNNVDIGLGADDSDDEDEEVTDGSLTCFERVHFLKCVDSIPFIMLPSISVATLHADNDTFNQTFIQRRTSPLKLYDLTSLSIGPHNDDWEAFMRTLDKIAAPNLEYLTIVQARPYAAEKCQTAQFLDFFKACPRLKTLDLQLIGLPYEFEAGFVHLEKLPAYLRGLGISLRLDIRYTGQALFYTLSPQCLLPPLPPNIQPLISKLCLYMDGVPDPMDWPVPITLPNVECIEVIDYGSGERPAPLQWYFQGLRCPNLKQLDFISMEHSSVFSQLSVLLPLLPQSCKWNLDIGATWQERRSRNPDGTLPPRSVVTSIALKQSYEYIQFAANCERLGISYDIVWSGGRRA